MKTWKPYGVVTLLVGALTGIIHVSGLGFDLVNIALIYLFPVLYCAVYWGLKPSFYAAGLGVLAFDYFFVPHVLSFSVADLRYLFSFSVYLAIAALTASLAARLKQQLAIARKQESHTALLYDLSHHLTAITSLKELLESVSGRTADIVGEEVVIYLHDEREETGFRLFRSGQAEWGMDSSLLAIVGQVMRHRQMAGRGSHALREQPGLFLPLGTQDQIYGVVAVNLENQESGLPPDTVRLLEAFLGLAAAAIDRVKLSEEAKLAQVTAESERLRTAILDSVSHELRTPLASIIGSTTGLIESEQLLTPEDRRDLLMTIREGALRMNRLVNNLLGMVRLESGMLKMQQKWCDVEDVIGVVLSQLRDSYPNRTIRVHVPDGIPLLKGDDVLLEQMLGNLVSNAVKYSPDFSTITISVEVLRSQMRIAVTDEGIGIPVSDRKLVFDKFYRAEAARRLPGTGLGLAICKGIVEAHRGSIAAESHGDTGTSIVVMLPLEEPPTGGRLSSEGVEQI